MCMAEWGGGQGWETKGIRSRIEVCGVGYNK